MNIKRLLFLTDTFHKEESSNIIQLELLTEQTKDSNIPLDYLHFISLFDGAEGAIGADGYLAIWNLNDVIEVNRQYDEDPVFNNYFIFGSSGGTFHYAFKKNIGGIYELDLYEDLYSRFLGDSLTEFLEGLSAT